MAELTVQIDPAEVRIQTDRLAVLVTGAQDERLQWAFSSDDENTAVDPATYTGFLVPAWMHPDWGTTAVTPFLIRKADTDKAASASWVEKNFGFNGNVYLHALGVNEVITTTASFERNMPWWLSYYAYGEGDTFSQMEMRFGTGAEEVYLKFWTDNTVHIFKAGAFIGSVNLTQSKAWERAARATEGGAGPNNQDRPIDIFILPCRRRELLIYSSAGGTGNFVFDDIDKAAASPTILPAGQVSWYVAEGQASFQAAPAKKSSAGGNFFATAGYFLSKTLELRQVPAAGAVPTSTAFYDLPYYDADPTVTAQLVDIDGVTPFVGNGTKKQCKLKVSMTGGGKNTPFIYGGQSVFTRVTVNTPDSPVTVDDYLIEASLNVPDSPQDVTLDLKLKNQPALSILLPNITRTSNRPMVAKIGTIPIVTGRLYSPRYLDMPTPESEDVMLECRDRWGSFETKRITDPTPFDGRLLSDVIKELAMLPGYPLADMDVEDFGLTLDSTGQSSKGEWALLPEKGDTVSDWLQRLWEDFAKTSIMGWYPSATGPKFRFRMPAEYGGTLSVVETATVYDRRSLALAAGYTEANHWLKTYQMFSNRDSLRPECNDLRITGWDRRVDKAFQSHLVDAAAKDPTTAVASRPDNWVGEPWVVAVWDPAITTQAMASYAAGIIGYRTFPVRLIREWACQMQFKTDGSPLWRGDVMKLDQLGRFRIMTLSCEFVMESSLDFPVRNCVYVGEYLGA